MFLNIYATTIYSTTKDRAGEGKTGAGARDDANTSRAHFLKYFLLFVE